MNWTQHELSTRQICITETTTSYNSIRKVRSKIKNKHKKKLLPKRNSWFVGMTLSSIYQVIIGKDVKKRVRSCANDSAGDNGEDKLLWKQTMYLQL